MYLFSSERPLRAVLFLSLLLLAVMTWAVVWQAHIIQDQKRLIREMSGMAFEEDKKSDMLPRNRWW